MKTKHTPGPYERDEESTNGWTAESDHVGTVTGEIDGSHMSLALFFADGTISEEMAEANARLFMAAPDHALFASAICAALARWEAFPGGRSGEVCVGGLRYATKLDEFGCPVIADVIRSALEKALTQ